MIGDHLDPEIDQTDFQIDAIVEGIELSYMIYHYNTECSF